MKRARALLIAAAVLLPGTAPPPVAARAMEGEAPPREARARWTPERMRAARPLPGPRAAKRLGPARPVAGPAPTAVAEAAEGRTASPPTVRDPVAGAAEVLFRVGDAPPEGDPGADALPSARGSLDWLPFSHRRVGGASTRRQWPYRTVGKLFGTLPGLGDFTCSGAVVGMRLVATAAHCLYDQWRELQARDVVFVPAFDQEGATAVAPFGRWTATRLLLPPEYVQPSDGSVHPADFALVVVADRSVGGRQRRIGELTGTLGWRAFERAPNLVHQFGYPGNLDRGLRLQETVAQTVGGLEFGERTGEPLNGLGALVTLYGGPQEDGASGGPLVADLGIGAAGDASARGRDRNQIVGVVGFGLTAIDYVGGFTTLNARWQRLFRQACAQRPGNC